jgi:ribonuclease-3
MLSFYQIDHACDFALLEMRSQALLPLSHRKGGVISIQLLNMSTLLDQTTSDDLMLIAEKINGLSQALGATFANPELLKTALSHRSYLNENPSSQGESNERLEFLGDAVLDLVIAQELYQRYPQLPEGQLSKLRSHAVNEQSLAQLARHLRLEQFLLVGRGESKRLSENDAILADAVEAIVAVIYLEQGLSAVQKLWYKWQLEMQVDFLDEGHLEHFDAKSQLQEYCLKNWRELPKYEFQEKNTKFRVTLVIKSCPLLSTEQVSKKKAELWLAQQCLQHNLHLNL